VHRGRHHCGEQPDRHGGNVGGRVAGPRKSELYIEETPGSFIVFGVARYHSNYPSGTNQTVKHGKYTDPAAPIAPVLPSLLGFSRPGLSFAEWTFDAAGKNKLSVGTAIGEESVDLYGQWNGVFRLTVHHVDVANGRECLPRDEIYLREGAIYVFDAAARNGYTPTFVVYTVSGSEYRSVLGASFRMPAEEVEATIYYRYTGDNGNGNGGGGGSGGAGGGSVPRAAAGAVRQPGARNIIIMSEDVPMAGIWTCTRGIAVE